jgi:hypothetical protein
MLFAAALLAYTVQPGDTLSQIAASHGESLATVEALNPMPDFNLIFPGQRIRLSGSIPAQAASYVVSPVSIATVTSGSSYESCVIARESSGDPTAVNSSSGAGGLYGFLPSTWQSLGYAGLPENAPVAEQQAAFDTLYAESGRSPWITDGC